MIKIKPVPIISMIWAVAFFVTISFALAQDSTYHYDDIRNAITKGGAKELAIHFNTSISLSVPGKEGTFSKVQAELIIKDFFDKNKPQSFRINHQGSSNDGSQYAIGTLTSTNNTYRIYFLVKKTKEKYLIHQLDIEEE